MSTAAAVIVAAAVLACAHAPREPAMNKCAGPLPPPLRNPQAPTS